MYLVGRIPENMYLVGRIHHTQKEKTLDFSNQGFLYYALGLVQNSAFTFAATRSKSSWLRFEPEGRQSPFSNSASDIPLL